MSGDDAIICRFFDGPWDGRTEMRGDAPRRIVVPVSGEIRITANGPEEVAPSQDVMYQRGPIDGETADYRMVR